MKKTFTTKQLTTTALLLALCIVFQCFKGTSPVAPYLTGSAVNCILVVATLYCGLWSGTCIAILTPVIAYFIGATPIVNMLPVMMPVIMIGNECLVLGAGLLKKKNLILGLSIGCIIKTAFLWLTVWFAVLPLFGAKLPAPVVLTAKTMFSFLQLVAACIGSVIAWVIYKKGIRFYEDIGNR